MWGDMSKWGETSSYGFPVTSEPGGNDESDDNDEVGEQAGTELCQAQFKLGKLNQL